MQNLRDHPFTFFANGQTGWRGGRSFRTRGPLSNGTKKPVKPLAVPMPAPVNLYH